MIFLPLIRHEPRPTSPAVALIAPPWPMMIALPSVVEVPVVGERQRHQLLRIELVVGFLRLAGGAVEEGVDDDAVEARIAAGADVGVADAGDGRQHHRPRLRKPRAFLPHPRQRRHDRRVLVEVIGAHRIEHEHRDDAWPRVAWRDRFGQHASCVCREWRGADQRANGRRNVLLLCGRRERSALHERRAVEQHRDSHVVIPRRAVHELVERIARGDEPALLRHDEDLSAAPRKISAREHVEPLLPLRRWADAGRDSTGGGVGGDAGFGGSDEAQAASENVRMSRAARSITRPFSPKELQTRHIVSRIAKMWVTRSDMMPRMKKRVLFATICLCATIAVALSAQRPADAPATAPSGKPPDSVFIEDLTWAEVRDLIASGTTNVIVGTAGTEQKGPHMVDGEHKFVMEWSADKIARGDGQDARRAGRDLRARGQLGKHRRPHGQAGHDHAARRSLRRSARQRRQEPQGRRLQEDLVRRRVRRQPHRHADGGREAERAVERRRDRLLGR